MSDLYPEPTFTYKQAKQFRSYKAGKQFARIMLQVFPHLDNRSLTNVVRSFRLNKSYFDVEWYCIGFEYCYITLQHAGGNMLPLGDVQKRLEILMGKLAKAQKEMSEDVNSTFISASQLAELRSVFCIVSIESEVGRYGPQWTLSIIMDGVQAGDPSEPTVLKTLTFQKGTPPNSRDRALEALVSDTPVHNCMVRAIETKSGRPYYDFAEASGTCVCGYKEEPDELDDLDEHPF